MPKLLLLFLLIAGRRSSGKTCHEVPLTLARQPIDAKQNSSAVPDVYAITTQFDRVVILRFKFDTPTRLQVLKDGEG